MSWAKFGAYCDGAWLLLSDSVDCESPFTMAYAIAAPAAAPISVPTMVFAALLPSSDFWTVWVCIVYEGGGIDLDCDWWETTEGAALSISVGALETARDLVSDAGGAMLSAFLTVVALLLLETTDPFSSRAIVGPPASDATTEAPGRYAASMLFPSKSMIAAL